MTYYIVKIISSLTNKLDFFWLYTSQSGFRGLSRYPDLQFILFNLSCRKENILISIMRKAMCLVVMTLCKVHLIFRYLQT